jgi:hypothetical protein
LVLARGPGPFALDNWIAKRMGWTDYADSWF